MSRRSTRRECAPVAAGGRAGSAAVAEPSTRRLCSGPARRQRAYHKARARMVVESNEEIPHSHIDGVSLLTVQLGTVPAWVAAAISVVPNTAGIPFGLSVPPPKDGDRDGRS